jgi:hypothetical protein
MGSNDDNDDDDDRHETLLPFGVALLATAQYVFGFVA